MNENYSNNDSHLDKVWHDNGVEQCKNVFYEACESNPQNAAALLNDQQLSFPCLFILMPQIKSFGLYSSLNFRNVAAIRIVNRILRLEESAALNDNLPFWENNVQPVLKWMIETGNLQDSLNDDYEEVLDIAASVLINIYKHKDILPTVTDMIFQRHKKGGNIHTLVWSVFSIHEPNVLNLIAEHIRSSDKQESELACNLLNIKIENKRDLPDTCQKKYEAYLQWLGENQLFLFFTDESLQFSSKPVPCKVDLARKYVHKANASHASKAVALSESIEEKCLQAFAPLSREEKMVLSDYSYKIYNQDVSQWSGWIQGPVEEQLKTAKAEMEGDK